MNKTRLEAFSDGVFAIVITLLILEVKIKDVPYDNLLSTMQELWPSVSAYALSFMLIGMYWVFHHNSFIYLARVDGVMLYLNILFLLTISFFPFPTMLLGRYPFETLPLVIYGCNLMLANLIGFLMLLYLRRNPHLASEALTDKAYKDQIPVYFTVNLLYAVCIAMAFAYPRVSVMLFGLVAIFLIYRSAAMLGIGKPKVDDKYHNGI